MQTHDLQVSKPSRRQRIGRGGKRGTYSGKGLKGQKARSGHSIRPAFRDIIKKLPKQRGYRIQPFRTKPIAVNVAALEEAFKEGAVITPKALIEAKLLRAAQIKQGVKILGNGELKKKFTLQGFQCSAVAGKKITAAGGTITA